MNEYNDIPVFYCKNCLSLKIRSIPDLENSEFCDRCDSSEIGTLNIHEWEELFKDRYGYNYLRGVREEY